MLPARHFSLRGLTQYRATDTGLLFRYGESILPVRGNSAQTWYRSMHSYLNRSILPTSREADDPRSENAFHRRLCDALRSADMLYEGTDNGLQPVSSTIRSRYRSQISRLEATSNEPLRLFAAVRARSLLVVTPYDIAFAVVEAAIESGMANIDLCVPEGRGELQTVIDKLRSHYADDIPDLRLRTLSLSEAGTSDYAEGQRRYIVVAAAADKDWVCLDETLNLQLPARDAVALSLCIGNARVIAGRIHLQGKTCCTSCMRKYASPRAESAREGMSKCIEDVEIGARMVFQQLWDIESNIPGAMLDDTILEFDHQTSSMKRRSRPTDTNCALCAGVRRSSDLDLTDYWDSHSEISLRELCRRTESVFVDDGTGLLTYVDGGELLQYPFAKCGALIAQTYIEQSSPRWCVESGDDLTEARWSAISRAVEIRYEETLQSQGHQGLEIPFFSGHDKYICSDAPCRGSVVSSSRLKDLKAEAFFRALAVHAHGLENWRRLAWTDRPRSSDVELGYAYLDDLGVHRAVLVEAYSLGESGVQGLRFRRHDETISVVVGSDWERLWVMGLRDVCLERSSPSFSSHDSPSGAPRFRTAFGKDVDATLEQHMKAVRKSTGCELWWSPLRDSEMTRRLPFYLAYARISDR